jgi:hypothetical protein
MQLKRNQKEAIVHFAARFFAFSADATQLVGGAVDPKKTRVKLPRLLSARQTTRRYAATPAHTYSYI